MWAKKASLDEIKLNARAGEVLDIYLAPSLFLIKTIRVPAAARSNLEQVVKITVRQSSPGGGSNLVWRHKIAYRTAGELCVEIAILKDADLLMLEEQARAARASIRQVRSLDPDIRLPFLDSRKTTDRPIRVWSLATIILLLLTTLWVGWREIRETNNLEAELKTLNMQSRQLAERALEMKEATDQKDVQLAHLHKAIEVFEDDGRYLSYLLDLTEFLGDSTWISEASINHDSATLSGFTTDEVPALLSGLQTLAWIARAELDGPVSFDSQTRSNRFDFVLKIRRDRFGR